MLFDDDSNSFNHDGLLSRTGAATKMVVVSSASAVNENKFLKT